MGEGQIFATNINSQDKIIQFDGNPNGVLSSIYFDGGNFKFNSMDASSIKGGRQLRKL
jgi:hypothetical protein